MFLWKGILQICSKITNEHPCQSVIIVTLLCSFIEIRLQHRCSPENFINIFRKSSQINTCGLLLLLFSLITEIFETLTWRCFVKVSSTKKWNLEEKKKENMLWRRFWSVKCTIWVYKLGSHRNFKYFLQSYIRTKFHACAIKWSILVYFDTYKPYCEQNKILKPLDIVLLQLLSTFKQVFHLLCAADRF